MTPSGYWADERSARERLITDGARHLTAEELLTVILQHGSNAKYEGNESAKALLKEVKFNISALYGLTPAQLSRLSGISDAKAALLAAAFELANRIRLGDLKRKTKITGAEDAFEVVYPLFHGLQHEEFRVILLNRANEVIRTELVSKGGVAGTYVDPKMVFKPALLETASGMVVCHNHPSGILEPSIADKHLTERLEKGARVLDIALIDHIIIGRNDYYSFKESGLLDN